MAKLTFKGAKSKRIVLAQNHIAEFSKFDGLTLPEVNQMTNLVDVRIGSNEVGDKTIHSLILEFKEKKVAFPLSRGISVEDLDDDDNLANYAFYLRNKKNETDGEGEYTGALYISYGKSSGITMDEERSLMEPEVVGTEVK